MVGLLDTSELDTRLARLLHREGLLELSLLQEHLNATRATRESSGITLARTLVTRGLLSEPQVTACLQRLVGGGPAGALGVSDSGNHGLPGEGEVIDGRYEVQGLLGRGGMGAVFRAFDRDRGQAVALKMILPGLAEHVDLLRFEREAQLTARVDRKGGVVRVHALGHFRGHPYCVMELVEGRSLDAAFRAGLGPAELSRIVEAIARTLSLCHAEGVVHRDLKPANVLLSAPDDTPKLLDFGLAFDLHDSTTRRLTQTGEILGSPAYMAPEQAHAEPGTIDARTDVYALGAMLYEGLAGRPPFVGPLLQVLLAVSTEDPVPPSHLNPRVPPALEAVCLRALAKAPEARYPGALELADDLVRAREGRPLHASASGTFSGLRRRNLRWIVWGTLVLLIPTLAAAAPKLWEAWQTRRAAATLSALEALDGTPGPTGEAGPLERWRLGLGGQPAPALDLDLLARRLAGAQRRVGNTERVLALAERLRAHRRLLQHRRGTRVSVPRVPSAGRGPTELLVDAIVLAERGETERALAHTQRAEARLKRWGRPRLLAHLRAVARYAFEEGLRRAFAEATTPAGDRARARVRRVIRAAAPEDVESLGHLAQAKQAALEAAVPAWRAEIAGVLAQPSEGAALGWFDRLAGVLGEPIPVRPGPALQALLEEVLGAFARAWRDDSTLERTLVLLRIDGARLRRVDWERTLIDPAVGEALTFLLTRYLDRALREPEAYLATLRVPKDAVGFDMTAQQRGARDREALAALRALHPESQALRHMAFRVRFRSADWSDPQTRALLAEARAVLAGRIQDLSPEYLARTHYYVAKAHLQFGEHAPPEEREVLAEEALRYAREGESLADWWPAHLLYDLRHTQAEALERLGELAAAGATWDRTTSAFRVRIADIRAGRATHWSREEKLEQRMLCRGLESWILISAGHPQRQTAIARDLAEVGEALGDEFFVLLGRRVESESLRAQDRFDAADAALRPAIPAGLERDVHFAHEWVEVARARGELGEALERSRRARALHPDHPLLQSQAQALETEPR